MKNSKKFEEQFEIVKTFSNSEDGFEHMENLWYEVEMEMIYVDDTRLEEFKKLNKLNQEIKRFMEKHQKKKSSFDPEAVLDWMFPDRHDEDFDEDNMNLDSEFGDD